MRPCIQPARLVSPGRAGRVLCWPSALLIMLFSMNVRAAAQSDAGGAAIDGMVVNETGAGVANAKVTLRNLDGGFTRSLISDANGHFSVQAIPVGHYQVEASTKDGISRIVELQLTVGASETVMLTIRPADGQEGGSRMVVKSGAHLASSDNSAAASVQQRLIEEAPIRGRAFADFVLLTPGIVQEATANGLSISGQRSINSNMSIDGFDFNDPLRGNQRGGNDAIFFFPLSAVREFQVVNGGASAEVGRTTAGFINVVTRSGTNDWHGEGFYLDRPEGLTSNDAFGDPVDTTQHQFGGALGGPLRRDRIFEFLSAEQNFLRVPYQVAFLPQPAGVTLPATLAALQGPQTTTNDVTALVARTDVTLSARHTLSTQYSHTRLDQQNVSNPGPSTPAARSTNYYRSGSSHGLRVSLVSSSSRSLINELRGQIGTDFRDEYPNTATPQINIDGVGQIGGDTSRPRIFESTRYQLADAVSFSRSRHNFRLGIDANFNPERQESESNIGGRYDFTSLANFNAGIFSRYRGTIPLFLFGPKALVYSGSQRTVAFFSEDKFSLRRDFTFTLGLRWEGQLNPQPVHPNPAVPETQSVANDLSQWQPRTSLAWNVGGTGRSVVRLFAGTLAADTPGTLLQRDFTDNGLTTLALDSALDPRLLTLAPYPNILTTAPPNAVVAPPDVVGFDQNFRNPRSLQTGASFQQALGEATLISAEYLHSSSWDLQLLLDRNLFAPTIDPTGMPIFPLVRPNTNFRRILVNRSEAHSDYDALIIAARRRLVKRLQFQTSYALSRNRDNDSNERSTTRQSALNPFDLSLERAYANTDVRHNLSMSGIMDLPRSFTVSTVMLARSGLPYTPIIGFDTQNDGNDTNDRAIINGVVAGRNSLRQDAFFNLDLRLSKSFLLERGRHLLFSVECNNVTRNGNKNFGSNGVSVFGTPTNPSPTAGMPTSAPPTSRFGGPRQVQFGMSFVF